jgi:HlyD family secretion protein
MIKKVVPWIVALLVVLGIGYAVVRWQKGHAAPEVEWKTAPVEKRRVVARVTASGQLQATVTVQVGAQVSGRVQTLLADFNDSVKKGQLIAKIDPQLFAAAVEQARANHLSATASLQRAAAQERDAEMNLARANALSQQQLASGSEVQTANTNLAVAKAATLVAKATLEQTTAALRQAQVNLSYTEIHSPIDGTIISRSVDVGQTVAASLQAPVLFTIAEDLRKMQVHTNVGEGDVGRLEKGMEASFTVDAFPGKRFKGVIAQIRNAPQTVQNVVTYDAVLDVDNDELKLRPGMTATVTIVWSQRDDVVAVPNTALRFRLPPELAASASASGGPPAASNGPPVAAGSNGPGGGGGRGGRAGGGGGGGYRAGDAPESRTVYVLRGGSPVPVSITTGLSDGTITEVAKGEIAAGDAVVTDVAIAGKPTGGAAAGAPAGGTPRLGRMF